MIKPIEWTGEKLRILDQVKLPHEEIWIDVHSVESTIQVISQMNVRGAPLIGFVGLFGACFIARDFEKKDWKKQSQILINARPTAVNLAYEVERAFLELEKENISENDSYHFLISFTLKTIEEAQKKHEIMAHWAEVALRKYVHKDNFLLQTHCNTGSLACGTLGTALGVIERLGEKNCLEKVWVDETRPYLQGSRLTAFELSKMNIPYEIVVEGAASLLMSRGYVDAIFVGADRIAKNGDTANKIGTANLALIAQKYHVPFFVVAPLSSFDFSLDSGRDIEIELRGSEEILTYQGKHLAPYDALAFNPSFDITPADMITGIISEKGIVERPTEIKLKEIFLK